MWTFENNATVVQQKLLERGIIDIASDDLNGTSAVYVREALNTLLSRGAPDVLVTITSDGGLVDVGLGIYDMIRLYPGVVTGKVVGYARSMAAVILQACDVRECARHASIRIHNIRRNSIKLNEVCKPSALAKIRANMERDQSFINKILSDRTGQPLSVIRRTNLKEMDMSAKEALHFGLIDKIV